MQKKSQTLSLNQETLKNLTEGELRKVEGGILSKPHIFSCPECNPPAGKEKK